MVLTPETGSGTAGANTYATVAELRVFAEARGQTVPQASADCEAMLIRAMDYLLGFESRWKGCRVKKDQPLAWPRVGACQHGYPIDYDTIPQELKNAQMALAIEAKAADLLPTRTPEKPGGIKRDTIGPLTQEFATPLIAAVYAKAEVFLKPLCKAQGMLWNVRA